MLPKLTAISIFYVCLDGILGANGSFLVVPRNVSVDFGQTIYQACRPSNMADSISWYVKNTMIGACSRRTGNILKQIRNPRYKIYMSFDDYTVTHSNSSGFTCFLVVENAAEEDTGSWKCMTSNTDSTISEVSADVVVFDQRMNLDLLMKEDHIYQAGPIQVGCLASKSRPQPQVRLLLGGIPIEAVKSNPQSDRNGYFNVTATAEISLIEKNHLELFTCHVDIGGKRNVRQTYHTIHVAASAETVHKISVSKKYLLWLQLFSALRNLLF